MQVAQVLTNKLTHEYGSAGLINEAQVKYWVAIVWYLFPSLRKHCTCTQNEDLRLTY